MSVPNPAPTPDAAGADPSMEDILASIRRILSEEEEQAAEAAQSDPADEVFELDESMLRPVAAAAVPEPVEAAPPRIEPPAPSAEPATVAAPVIPPPAQPAPIVVEPLIASEPAAMAIGAMGELVRSLQSERSTPVYRGGPTLEDLVREEMRPLLKSWLDTHLPGMVERVVRSEIERLAGRAGV